MPDIDKFDEYKFFINDTTKLSDRRQRISNTYITVNSLLLSVIGLLSRELKNSEIVEIVSLCPIIIAGMTISIWWRQLILKYKELIGLRMDTLRNMEVHLKGSVKMYHLEDKFYQRDANDKIISDKSLNFSDVEKRLPWVFFWLYVLCGICLLASVL